MYVAFIDSRTMSRNVPSFSPRSWVAARFGFLVLDVLHALGLEVLLHDDERHVVLLRELLEQFEQRDLVDVRPRSADLARSRSCS